MAMKDTLATAQLYTTAIGIPIALAALCVILPMQYTEALSIQRIADKVDTLKDSVDATKGAINRVEAHLTESESDPAKILSKVMGVSADDVSIGTVSFIGGDVVVFPRTLDGKEKLVQYGWRLKDIGPTISGYVPVQK